MTLHLESMDEGTSFEHWPKRHAACVQRFPEVFLLTPLQLNYCRQALQEGRSLRCVWDAVLPYSSALAEETLSDTRRHDLCSSSGAHWLEELGNMLHVAFRILRKRVCMSGPWVLGARRKVPLSLPLLNSGTVIVFNSAKGLFTPDKQLLMLLRTYLQELARMPFYFEVLVCTSRTTVREVRHFVRSWDAMARPTHHGRHIEALSSSSSPSDAPSVEELRSASPYLFAALHVDNLSPDLRHELVTMSQNCVGHNPLVFSSQDGWPVGTPLLFFADGADGYFQRIGTSVWVDEECFASAREWVGVYYQKAKNLWRSWSGTHLVLPHKYPQAASAYVQWEYFGPHCTQVHRRLLHLHAEKAEELLPLWREAESVRSGKDWEVIVQIDLGVPLADPDFSSLFLSLLVFGRIGGLTSGVPCHSGDTLVVVMSHEGLSRTGLDPDYFTLWEQLVDRVDMPPSTVHLWCVISDPELYLPPNRCSSHVHSHQPLFYNVRHVPDTIGLEALQLVCTVWDVLAGTLPHLYEFEELMKLPVHVKCNGVSHYALTCSTSFSSQGGCRGRRLLTPGRLYDVLCDLLNKDGASPFLHHTNDNDGPGDRDTCCRTPTPSEKVRDGSMMAGSPWCLYRALRHAVAPVLLWPPYRAVPDSGARNDVNDSVLVQVVNAVEAIVREVTQLVKQTTWSWVMKNDNNGCPKSPCCQDASWAGVSSVFDSARLSSYFSAKGSSFSNECLEYCFSHWGSHRNGGSLSILEALSSTLREFVQKGEGHRGVTDTCGLASHDRTVRWMCRTARPDAKPDSLTVNEALSLGDELRAVLAGRLSLPPYGVLVTPAVKAHALFLLRQLQAGLTVILKSCLPQESKALIQLLCVLGEAELCVLPCGICETERDLWLHMQSHAIVNAALHDDPFNKGHPSPDSFRGSLDPAQPLLLVLDAGAVSHTRQQWLPHLLRERVLCGRRLPQHIYLVCLVWECGWVSPKGVHHRAPSPRKEAVHGTTKSFGTLLPASLTWLASSVLVGMAAAMPEPRVRAIYWAQVGAVLQRLIFERPIDDTGNDTACRGLQTLLPQVSSLPLKEALTDLLIDIQAWVDGEQPTETEQEMKGVVPLLRVVQWTDSFSFTLLMSHRQMEQVEAVVSRQDDMWVTAAHTATLLVYGLSLPPGERRWIHTFVVRALADYKRACCMYGISSHTATGQLHASMQSFKGLAGVSSRLEASISPFYDWKCLPRSVPKTEASVELLMSLLPTVFGRGEGSRGLCLIGYCWVDNKVLCRLLRHAGRLYRGGMCTIYKNTDFSSWTSRFHESRTASPGRCLQLSVSAIHVHCSVRTTADVVAAAALRAARRECNQPGESYCVLVLHGVDSCVGASLCGIDQYDSLMLLICSLLDWGVYVPEHSHWRHLALILNCNNPLPNVVMQRCRVMRFLGSSISELSAPEPWIPLLDALRKWHHGLPPHEQGSISFSSLHACVSTMPLDAEKLYSDQSHMDRLLHRIWRHLILHIGIVGANDAWWSDWWYLANRFCQQLESGKRRTLSEEMPPSYCDVSVATQDAFVFPAATSNISATLQSLLAEAVLFRGSSMLFSARPKPVLFVGSPLRTVLVLGHLNYFLPSLTDLPGQLLFEPGSRREERRAKRIIRQQFAQGTSFVLLEAPSLATYLIEMLQGTVLCCSTTAEANSVQHDKIGHTKGTLSHPAAPLLILSDTSHRVLNQTFRTNVICFSINFGLILPSPLAHAAKYYYNMFRVQEGSTNYNVLSWLAPGLTLDTVLSLCASHLLCEEAAQMEFTPSSDGSDTDLCSFNLPGEPLVSKLSMLLAPVICPRHYILLLHCVRGGCGGCPSWLCSGPAALRAVELFSCCLSAKDNLVSAYGAYRASVADGKPGRNSKAVRHAVVFTSQAVWCQSGSDYDARKLRELWSSLCASEPSWDDGCQGICDIGERFAVQHVTWWSTNQMRHLLHTIRDTLRTASQRTVFPLVLCLDTSLWPAFSSGKRTLERAGDDPHTVAFHLCRLWSLLREAKLDCDTRLHVAFMVVFPSEIYRLQEEDNVFQWCYGDSAWAFLHVDEVMPSTWTAMAEEDWCLSDAADRQETPLEVVRRLPSLQRHLLRSDLRHLLADIVDLSPMDYCERVELGVAFQRVFRPGCAVGDLLLRWMQRYITTSVDVVIRGAPFRWVSLACASLLVTRSWCTVRSFVYHEAGEIVRRILGHLLTSLVSSAEELWSMCRAERDDVVERWLRHALDSGVTTDRSVIVLDPYTSLDLRAPVVLPDELRRRQPVWCRGVRSQGRIRALPYCPFSYSMYRVYSLYSPSERKLLTSLMNSATNARNEDIVVGYCHDAIGFFLEEHLVTAPMVGEELDNRATIGPSTALVCLTLYRLTERWGSGTKADGWPAAAPGTLGDAIQEMERLCVYDVPYVMRAYDWALSKVEKLKGNLMAGPLSRNGWLRFLVAATREEITSPMPALHLRVPSNTDNSFTLRDVILADGDGEDFRESRRWWANMQRLFLALPSVSHEDLAARAEREDLARALLSHVSVSPRHACEWLIEQNNCSQLVRQYVAPLLVAYVHHEVSQEEWKALGTRLLRGFTCDRRGLLCEPYLFSFLVRSLLRIWLRQKRSDRDVVEPFPLSSPLGSLCESEVGALAAQVVVAAITSELLGEHDEINDIRWCDRLWAVAQLSWGTSEYISNSQCTMAFCVAVGVLQAQWRASRGYPPGWDGAAILRERLALLHIKWVSYLERRQIPPSETDLYNAPLLLLLRVLSSRGQALPYARQYLRLYLPLSLLSHPLSEQVLHRRTLRGPLNAILHSSFFSAMSLSDCVTDQLRICVEYLCAAFNHERNSNEASLIDDGEMTVPTLTQVNEPLSTTCQMLRVWFFADASIKWDNESVMCLAGVLLACVGTSGEGSFVKRVTTSQLSLCISLCDIRITLGTNKAAQAAALVRFMRAAVAFGACLVRGEKPSRLSYRSQAMRYLDRLLPFCPRCKRMFVDFNACTALQCEPYEDLRRSEVAGKSQEVGNAKLFCRVGICGWCLTEQPHPAHPHVEVCPYNPNRGAAEPVFPRQGTFQWQRAYIRNIFIPRLHALERGESSVYLTDPEGNTMQFDFLEGLEDVPELDVWRGHRHYLRYLAYDRLASSPSLLPTALAEDVVFQTVIGDLVPSVQLDTYEVCCAELENATAQLHEAFRGQSRHSVTYAPVLKAALGYVGKSTWLNQVGDVTYHDVPSEVGFKEATEWVRQHADEDASLSTLLRKLSEGGMPTDNMPVSEEEAIERLFVDVEPIHAPLAARQLISHHVVMRELTQLRESFCEEAAKRLCFMLNFCFDARSIVQKRLSSVREVRHHTLTFLTDCDSRLFPFDRTLQFVRTAQQMLAHLQRGDNECCAHHQSFAVSRTTSPAAVPLEECLYTCDQGPGSLLAVLMAGTDEGGSDSTVMHGSNENMLRHVGYGNAQDGQEHMLHLLSEAQIAFVGTDGSTHSNGEVACRCIPGHPFHPQLCDLLQYEPSWTEDLVAVYSHTGLPAVLGERENDGWLCDEAAVVRGVVCSRGLIGRSVLLPLPLLEFPAHTVTEALGCVVEYVIRRVENAATGHAQDDAWCARVQQIVLSITQRPWRAEKGALSWSPKRALFSFLQRYFDCFPHTFSDRTCFPESGPDAEAPMHPLPPPAFALVPQVLLHSAAEQEAQNWLRGVPAADAPMLLVALWEAADNMLPDCFHMSVPTEAASHNKEIPQDLSPSAAERYLQRELVLDAAARCTVQRCLSSPLRHEAHTSLTVLGIALAVGVVDVSSEAAIKTWLYGYVDHEALLSLVHADAPMRYLSDIIRQTASDGE